MYKRIHRRKNRGMEQRKEPFKRSRGARREHERMSMAVIDSQIAPTASRRLLSLPGIERAGTWQGIEERTGVAHSGQHARTWRVRRLYPH
jgi:hypothetical protein